MAKDIVQLFNRDWSPRIRVQVRVGNGNAPTDPSNDPTKEYTITRGDRINIDSDGETVFWRRESNPGANPIAWNNWNARSTYGRGDTLEEIIR